MRPRPATPHEIDALADLFVQRWHDAHAACSSPGLVALRTREDCAARLRRFLAEGDLRAIGPAGAPLGFVALRGHHVDQLYVAASVVGRGAAQALMADAEATLRARGHAEAEVWCHTGNARAAAFYRKTGWRLRATRDVELDSSGGPFRLACFVFDKRLS